jgi:hypothetical protein
VEKEGGTLDAGDYLLKNDARCPAVAFASEFPRYQGGKV